MKNSNYDIRYLPRFYEDLKEKVVYISKVLHNTGAANRLIDYVEAAIIERMPIAESFEQVKSLKERKYPYYRIYVDNFVIYYVVIEFTTEYQLTKSRT